MLSALCCERLLHLAQTSLESAVALVGEALGVEEADAATFRPAQLHTGA